MAEIIDLTADSPKPIEISSTEEDLSTPTPTQDVSSNEKGRRNRKKKRSKRPITGQAGASTRNSVDAAQRGEEKDCDNTQSGPPPEVSAEDSQLFYFDAVAVPVPDSNPEYARQPTDAPSEDGSQDEHRLLLPSHVSLLAPSTDGTDPIEVIPPPVVDPDDDYIDFLDYEDRRVRRLVRYFEAEADGTAQAKPSIFKCKNCGAEGSHKTFECPVLICLTCGARDEHSTRSCPISKTCYTCGMKGHINKTCPNRFSRSVNSDLYDDCDRCGSKGHRTNECPTVWRIYQYVTDEERVLIRENRDARQHLRIGQGGEGYIGTDDWCYNCANTGHLGDDCDELPRSSQVPPEPSAFSAFNLMTGPFYDPTMESPRIRRGPRDLRESEDLTRLPDLNVPIDVGKRGRNKDRENLEKRFREQEDGEPGDWFNDMQNAKNRRVKEPPSRGKAMKFGASLKDGGRKLSPPRTSEKPRSLLARLGDGGGDEFRNGRDDTQAHSFRIRGAANHVNDSGRYRRRHDQQYRDVRSGDRDSGRRPDREHRPRYSGGYNR
ncbi:hypothetical protein EV401DRAFT_1866622 [Pisolithus croceorrhizus]|nr:hypothetical protein EV401DRAFT_1866622 [Pisolithus croceorrhizus]